MKLAIWRTALLILFVLSPPFTPAAHAKEYIVICTLHADGYNAAAGGDQDLIKITKGKVETTPIRKEGYWALPTLVDEVNKLIDEGYSVEGGLTNWQSESRIYIRFCQAMLKN